MTAVAHTEPGTARAAALRATSLVAGYGELAVVRGLDLEVRAGEIVALLGPNGAGKSTTLLTLAGELRPLGGEISWFGAPLTGGLHKRAAAGLGFVPRNAPSSCRCRCGTTCFWVAAASSPPSRSSPSWQAARPPGRTPLRRRTADADPRPRARPAAEGPARR
ncbi:ATP-binding cassette domain-containing protein [Streptomyces sp. INA 01156]